MFALSVEGRGGGSSNKVNYRETGHRALREGQRFWGCAYWERGHPTKKRITPKQVY